MHKPTNPSTVECLPAIEAAATRNQWLVDKTTWKVLKEYTYGMQWQKWEVFMDNPIRGQQILWYSTVYTAIHVSHSCTQTKAVRKYDLWEIYPSDHDYMSNTLKQTNTCQNRDTTDNSEYLNYITLIVKTMAQHSTRNLNFIKLHKLHTTIRNYWLLGMYAQV